MANDLTLFENTALTVPDYLKDFLADEDNIKPRAGVPTLSYAGRKWATIINGEKTTFMRKNAEGDEEPVGVLRVIILDCAQKRGRTYYDGPYDPETAKRPDCWSGDGEKPDPSVESPQAATCTGCPMSIKGSKIDAMGREAVACGQHRMIAVVPAGNLDHPPMRLRLAITSDFDGQSPDLDKAGWFAFRNYTDYLRTRQITHTAKVVTKIKFDPNKDFAKVIFSAERFVSEDQVARVNELVHSPEVKELITEKWTPNGADGTRTSQEPAPAQKNAQTERPKVIEGELTAEPFITDEMKATALAETKAAAAKKAADAKAAAAAKAKAAADKKAAEAKAATPPADEDDAFAASPAKSDTAAAPAKGGEVPADVADLLSAWG